MYAEVVVFTPVKSESFTYKVPTHMAKLLKVGSLVLVPFGKRNLNGVVLELSNKKPAFQTKDITSVFEYPFLLPHQIQLAKWISNYYVAPLYKVLKAILPPLMKRLPKESAEAKSDFNTTATDIKLTPEQQEAVSAILKNIGDSKNNKPFLLFGVTGSGKTEVYMRVIADLLAKGKQAIVLVPEIALTPQTEARFQARFPGQCAVLHSRLAAGSRFRHWLEILNGEKNIIIGSRSAIFAPTKNLGVIVVDEEHDHSYKQDQTPRYHVREVAKKLAALTGAGLVFGDATPTVETFLAARNGLYNFQELPRRVWNGKETQFQNLPKVEIVDMAQELEKKNFSVFSEALGEKIKQALEKHEQIFLFLNRRGASTYIICQECGYRALCPNCEIPLVLHLNYEKLKEEIPSITCHHCTYKATPPIVCPKCGGSHLRYRGTGTQKVEAEIKKLFPVARILRMDSDSMRSKNVYEETYQKIKNHEVDIVVGTQMITSGFHLPRVNLVGIIMADTALNFPDFRTEEQTFGLLTQVSGRAGREQDGEVLLQTYTPENPAILFSSKHDFRGFFEYEILSRQAFGYPPFGKFIRLVYTDKSDEKAKSKVEKVAGDLEFLVEKKNLQAEILGPSACFLHKIRGKYRHQILIKVKDGARKKSAEEENKTEVELKKYLTLLPRNWQIDIDPISML